MYSQWHIERPQWRLIYDLPTFGVMNMAIDEAIMGAVTAGEAPPTLRFYGWEPACLSLGYAQKVSDADLERLNGLGWVLVRRPTGGRAILHTDELTYSLCLKADNPIAAGGIVESYRRISQALMAGLQHIGAQPEADHRAERVTANGPVCFEVPSHYEITVGGRKLVGSAQMRRKEGVLQHGSLPLYGDLGRICDGLLYPDETSRETAKLQVKARALTLGEALDGQIVSWEAAAEALTHGFVETFGVDLVPGTLSEAEQNEAARLAEEVYGSTAWTEKQK